MMLIAQKIGKICADMPFQVYDIDGHPDMCCEAVDILGDGRDEIITWDYKSLWIYTQDDNPKPQSYHPVKFPDYNASILKDK
jgi:hypothetical protein